MTVLYQFVPRKILLLSFLFIAIILLIQITWFNPRVTRTFSQITFSVDHLNNEDISCIDRLASRYDRVEDIFCIVLPKFLPHLKSPCFYDIWLMNKKRLRCLPYFYIIGIDKSGSTDLHGRLAKHPLIYGNSGTMQKETQFWSWNRYGFMNKQKGNTKVTLDGYMDLFAHTAEMIVNHNDTHIIAGDATPMDLWDFRGWPMIPQNEGLLEPKVLTPHFFKYIYKVPPKLIIQLREPIERLYSDYIFLKYGKDPIEFHKHVEQAIDMMDACLSNHSRRFCYFDDDLYQKLPVRIHLSCYSVFLKEWFHVFPRDAFHVIRTTEYTHNMKSTLKDVFKFLEIPALSDVIMDNILNQTRRHVTANKTGIVLPETRELLRSYYSECNEETSRLLNDQRFLWLDHYS